jgi:5'-nucleotidase
VSYADVFASQPFRNQLITLTLTGAEIKAALEQQWLDEKRPRILQVSGGFSYAWDSAKPFGERVDTASMKLNGAPIEPAKDYRVTINNFLALGGDGFTAFKVDVPRQTGLYDDEALFAYFQANSPIAPAPPRRITRTN